MPIACLLLVVVDLCGVLVASCVALWFVVCCCYVGGLLFDV